MMIFQNLIKEWCEIKDISHCSMHASHDLCQGGIGINVNYEMHNSHFNGGINSSARR